ncbi:MAG: c-type cytochrome [Gemmatimonadota bacterium]|nr:c-type cytochrome [Gemmatimonadota bacterium]
MLSSRIQFAAVIVAGPLLLAALEHALARAQTVAAAAQPGTKQRVRFRVPADAELRDSGFRASALRGRAILLATRDSLPRYVGNSLRCASCHLKEGLQAGAMPWVGSYARFPQYRARSGKVDLIEDRINDCFRRSMNGRALNPAGRDMRDIVSYFAFLSSGLPVGAEMEGQGLPRLQPLPGVPSRGAAVFSSMCVRCHGAAGQGTALAPPLWGPRSYNVGAGMARINTAASFIHSLMPIDRAQQLTPQQAFDVATYINTRPRPNFPPKAHDWPHGGKPPDADYHVLPAPLPPKSATHPARAP